jgi:hypothetical protein
LSGHLVTITIAEVPNATIYYTIDATDPDRDSNEYTGPFRVDDGTKEIRAFGTHPYYSDSDIITYLIPFEFTSKPYPISMSDDGMVADSLEIKDFGITAGLFRKALVVYEDGLPENMEIKDFDIIAGVFRTTLFEYDLTESLEIKDFDITAGSFRQALISYEDGLTEDMEIKDFDITAGVFRKALITYDDGVTEDMEIKDFDITGGVHETP